MRGGGGEDGAVAVIVFQAPDDRRGIDHGFQAALSVIKIEGWQQFYLWLRQARRWVLMAAPDHLMRDLAIAHQGQHLSGIRGARCAKQFQPFHLMTFLIAASI